MSEHDDLQRRLRHLGTQPIDPGRQSADLTAMAGLARASRRPGLFGSKLRLAGAFLAGLLIGSTGLAAADALPDPAQHVAHTVLAQVGVDVPNPERYHGAECGTEVKKNHGAYVRDDHGFAQSDCGKPVGANGADADGDGNGNGNAPAKGACQGRPPWAGNKSMTDAEVAAAKAERAALCGTDVDDDADELEDEAEEPDEADAEDPAARGSESGEPTTTTAPATTTTTAAPTTTTEATTTTVAGATTSTTT